MLNFTFLQNPAIFNNVKDPFVTMFGMFRCTTKIPALIWKVTLQSPFQ